MTEYSDESCQNQLSSSKSYDNGQEYYNEYNQCVTQLTCTSATSVASTLPSTLTYNTVQYFSEYGCYNTPIQYQALQSMVCIPTDPGYAAETGIYAIESLGGELYEYSNVNCYSMYMTYRVYGSFICTNVNSYSSTAYSAAAIDSPISQPLHIDAKSSVTQDIHTVRNAYRKTEKKQIRTESTTPETASYGFGGDDTVGGMYYIGTTIYGETVYDDDIPTPMSSGAIAGAVIGSIFGFMLLGTIAVIAFDNFYTKPRARRMKQLADEQAAYRAAQQPATMPMMNPGVMMMPMNNNAPNVIYPVNPGVVPMQPPPGSLVYVMGPNNTLTPMVVPQPQQQVVQGTMMYATTNNPMMMGSNGAVPAVMMQQAQPSAPMPFDPNAGGNNGMYAQTAPVTAQVIADEENNKAMEK